MKTKAHKRYRLKKSEEWPRGRIVPGVTTIVGVLNKPALVPWANKLGLKGIEVGRFVDDKADIGTLGHAIIIDKLQGEETDYSDYSQNQIDSAENAALSFYEWQEKHSLEIISAEQPLVSEIHCFGGQYDIYGTIDDKLELLDLKTGSGVYEEHYYQLGGYSILLKENGLKIDQIRILNIPRSEDENFQEVILSGTMIELAEDMFFDCLKIYERKKVVKKLMKR